MRTVVEIPDAVYRRLKAQAAQEGRSVEELLLARAETKSRVRSKKRRRRVTFPIVPSKSPGTLDIDNAKIAELLFP